MSQKTRHAIPTKIREQCNLERITSSKEREFIKIRVFHNQTTSNDYVNSTIVDVRLFKDYLFRLINKDANGLKYKILACLEPDDWQEIKAETELAGNTKTYEWGSETWAYVKIQVKSSIADTPTTCEAYVGVKP